MRGNIIPKIREEKDLSQADLAKILGVSLRTITNWECNDADLPIAIAHQLRTTYQADYLKEALVKLTDAAFEAVPSEVANVWVVERTQCILFEGGDRLASIVETKQNDARHGAAHGGDQQARMDEVKTDQFDRIAKRKVETPTMVIPMEQGGLTTWPLRTAQTLNLHGSGITSHPQKRYTGTDAANYTICGKCLSLLYIPVFEPSAWGPIPVFLLCFQNKLRPGSLELPRNAREAPAFDNDDERRGREVAKCHQENMVRLLRELDMLETNRP